MHVMNPTRLAFIRSTLCRHFGKDPCCSRPFEGLKFVDAGCGGGILSEPLGRMGASVTGVDAVEKNRKIAQLHANLRFSAVSNGHDIKHHSCIRLLHDPARITSLNEAKCFHAAVITIGSVPTQEPVFLHNNVIAKYAALGDVSMARKVFDGMPERNVVTYNSMISCYAREGISGEALEVFSEMRECGFKPTEFTFGGVLSCRGLDVLEGMQVQVLIEKTGLFYVDAFAGTALLGMYGRHGCLDEALGIFESMPKKNLATWNSLIQILGQNGYLEDCVLMLSEMMMS